MELALTGWDYAIIAIYLGGILLHGWWVGRGHETADGYFLAARSLPWYLVGFSLYASNMSGSSFVGLMGASYQHGLVVFNYEWTAVVVLLFFALFMLPYFLKLRISTIPEFLERRFDARARRLYSLFTIIAIIFIDTAGALYAGGLIIRLLFPIFALWQAVALLGMLAGVYTIMGGLKSVVVTDSVQAVLLILGGICMLYFGLDAVGGWDRLMQQLDAEKKQFIRPLGDDFMPWTGIFGVILLGFYYWTLNQFIAQRTLGSKDLAHGQGGAMFAALLKLPNLLIMIIPGVIALVLYPNLERPDLAFPTLAFDVLPIGIRGVVLTALIAAIMSSLDSALNAAATLITLDFVRVRWPHLSDRALVRTGRVLTGVVMLVGMVYAPQIAHFQTLFDYVQSALAYIIPSAVAVYLMALFSSHINAFSAAMVLRIGLTVGVVLFILRNLTDYWELWGLPDMHYTNVAGLLFVIYCLLSYGLSYWGEKPDAQDLHHTTFTRGDFRAHLLTWRQPHLAACAIALAFAMTGCVMGCWFWV